MAPQAVIEKLVVPSTKERAPIEVDFTYSVEKPPVVALDAQLATPLGTVHQLLPASAAAIEGERGGGRFGFDLRALPPGAAELTLALVLPDGARGEPASARFEVPGGGGAAPKLGAVSVIDEKIARPGGDDVVYGRLALGVTAADEELVTLWVSVGAPDGTQTIATAAPPAGRKGTVAFAAFGAGHQLGTYGVAVCAIDAAGNVSQTREAKVELTDGDGARGPSVTAFKPVAAAAGDEVTLLGRGLDAQVLVVEVAGVPADVLDAQPTRCASGCPRSTRRAGSW
jgi:hypothetical protein